MTDREALMRIKTGDFNNGNGLDMQLLIDTVGTLGEMFRSGQINEVVRCKDCKRRERLSCPKAPVRPDNWFCADGEEK